MERDYNRFPDWFTGSVNSFSRHLSHLRGTPCQILQIGAYVGDATEWMVNNLIDHEDAFIVDVDPWTGSREHRNWIDFDQVEAMYDRRHKHWGNVVWKRKMTSREFSQELGGVYEWDFVYVDGDHSAKAVFFDGVLAFEDLKVGGIIAFDDYMWNAFREPLDKPKPGVDAFLGMYQDYLEVLEKNYQVWIKKTKELP